MAFFDKAENFIRGVKGTVRNAIDDRIEEEVNRDSFKHFKNTVCSTKTTFRYAFVPSQSDTFQRYIPIISPVDEKPKKIRKRRTTNFIERECFVCMELLPIPVNRITSSCEHDRGICKTCLEQYISTKCEKPVETEIQCPHVDCKEILGYENVLDYSADKDFEIHDEELARKAAEEDESFVWCAALNCRSGQFHPSRSNNVRVECHVCHEVTCFIHRILWHEGRTCDDYDRYNQDEKKTSEFFRISKIFRLCPACNVRVEKSEGCDHMTCNCKHEFCWECLAPYDGSDGIRSMGNTAHDPTCKYYA